MFFRDTREAVQKRLVQKLEEFMWKSRQVEDLVTYCRKTKVDNSNLWTELPRHCTHLNQPLLKFVDRSGFQTYCSSLYR